MSGRPIKRTLRGRLASLTTFAGNSSAAITCTTGC